MMHSIIILISLALSISEIMSLSHPLQICQSKMLSFWWFWSVGNNCHRYFWVLGRVWSQITWPDVIYFAFIAFHYCFSHFPSFSHFSYIKNNYSWKPSYIFLVKWSHYFLDLNPFRPSCLITVHTTKMNKWW